MRALAKGTLCAATAPLSRGIDLINRQSCFHPPEHKCSDDLGGPDEPTSRNRGGRWKLSTLEAFEQRGAAGKLQKPDNVIYVVNKRSRIRRKIERHRRTTSDARSVLPNERITAGLAEPLAEWHERAADPLITGGVTPGALWWPPRHAAKP